MKLTIISHTAHYKNHLGQFVGWGPTVKEINELSAIFSEITHVAPLHKGITPKSSIGYSKNIVFKPLKPSGGKWLKKANILITMPSNLRTIYKYCNDAEIIQFRAPTGIGLYVLPYLKYINKKPYWVKYAGNWVANQLTFGNTFQRWWLKKMLPLEVKVTVNGLWSSEKKNILAFENPCLSISDRLDGKEIVEQKEFSEKFNFCYVGGLTANKGVQEIIEVFKLLDKKNIACLHIVGDGVLKKQLELESKKVKFSVVFHGYLEKDTIKEIYKVCHFILLPSKSEGFPKVIGEAMNFGCIPIVSEVSCINQYVQNNYNGFLINPITVASIQLAVENSLQLPSDEFRKYINRNYQISKKFTYSYYVERIKKEILEVQN